MPDDFPQLDTSSLGLLDTSKVKLSEEDKQKAARAKMFELMGLRQDEMPPAQENPLRKLFPTTPLPIETGNLKTALLNPGGVASGVAKAGVDTVKSLADDVSHMWDAIIRPVSQQEASEASGSNAFTKSLSVTGSRLGEVAEHTPIVGGLIRSAKQSYEDAPLSKDPTFGAKVQAGIGAGVGAAGEFAAGEIQQLLGEKLEPAEIGENATSLLLKAGMLRNAGPETGAITEAFEGAPKDVARITRTKGEIAAAELANAAKKRELGNQLAETMAAQRARKAGLTSKEVEQPLAVGQSEVPLDERGQVRAVALQPLLQDFDKIYSSTLPRATQTAELATLGKVPTEPLEALRPQDIGEWAGKPTDEVHPELKRMAVEDPLSAPPGGESHFEFQQRLLPAVDRLIEESEASPDQRFGFIAHPQSTELLQAWFDAGAPKNYTVPAELYTSQGAASPGSVLRISKDAEGMYRMEETLDTSQPGLYAIHHGETALDGEAATSTVSETDKPTLPAKVWQEALARVPEGVLPKDPSSLSSPLMREFERRAIFDDMGRQALIRYMESGDMTFKALAQVANNPEIGGRILEDMVDSRGASPSDIREAFTGAFEHTISKGGYDLQGVSEVMKQLYDEAFPATEKGTVAERQKAMALRRDLASLKRLAERNSTVAAWNTLGHMSGKWERLRQGGLVSSLRTGFGIFSSQLGLAGADLADSLHTDLLNAFRGATSSLTRGSAPQDPLFNETLNFASSLGSRLSIGKEGSGFGQLMGKRKELDTLLDTIPRIKGQMMTGLLFDADSSLLGEMSSLVGAGANEAWATRRFEPLGEGLSAAASEMTKPFGQNIPFKSSKLEASYNMAQIAFDALNTFNKFQEAEFRKIAFGARLRSNLKVIPGAPAFGKDLIEYLNTGRVQLKDGKMLEFDPTSGEVTYQGPMKEGFEESSIGDIVPIRKDIREAIVDAESHAMRQTFAYTPEGGVFGVALRTMRPLTMIGPTFPRSLVNNLMWQMHHSPLWLADAMTPEFRDTFYQAGEKVTRQQARDASRQMGRAMTGALLMNAAVHMSQGGAIADSNDPSREWRVGPKSWLLTDGTRDKEGNLQTWDVSSYQPFVNYLDIAHILNTDITHQENHTKISEMIEHLLNAKASQIPIFTVEDDIRNLDSKDPMTVFNFLHKELGQYLGSWGASVRGVREEYQVGRNLLSGQPMDPKPSLVGEGPYAPVAQQLMPSLLLPRVDTFRGRLDVEEHPLQYITKTAPKALTPLEEALTRAEIDPYEIAKRYKDPHAEMMVKQEIGQMINNPNFKLGGVQLQQFAQKLIDLRNPTLSNVIFKELLPLLHQAGEELAMAKDEKGPGGLPLHFAPEEIKKVSLGQQSIEQQLMRRFYEKSREPLQQDH